MSQINWGIIGCGDVAEVKSGPAFQLVENSTLISVMRRDGTKAKDFAKRHQVPQWTDNADEIIEHKNINAVYIATPPSTHSKYALKALAAGKHVYLEKPMALDAIQAQQICDAVDKSKAKLTVAHYRRELPAFLKIREFLKNSAIGSITHADIQILQPRNSDIIATTEENWRLNPEVSGGGYFYDIAPHQIDLMYLYFGKIKNAHGYANSSIKNPLVENIVNGIINFKNGIQFRGLWNFNASTLNKKEVCTIYGTDGKIEFSFFGDTVRLENKNGLEVFSFMNPKHIQQPMIAATVDYFLGNTKNPCSAEEGLLVMNTLEKLSGRKSRYASPSTMLTS